MVDDGYFGAHGVGYSYARDDRQAPVLDGVDVRVGRGELVAVLGPSGCGKSTLLDVLAGLERPTRGSVVVDGVDVSGTTGHVSYMMQDDMLLPWRTVLDNVVLGPELSGSGREGVRARALELMDVFHLSGYQDHYPHALSGGMRQRVAFMRTVLCGKSVLLLDEPFRGLDMLTKSELHEWLLELWRRFGLTIVFVTHDPDEAVFLADRTYVLSPRPAVVRTVVDIDLPRPRTRDVLATAGFARLKGAVLAPLWNTDGGLAEVRRGG